MRKVKYIIIQLIEIEVAYFGLSLQPYKDINGVDTLIDTLWIYFKDGTFEQYANMFS